MSWVGWLLLGLLSVAGAGRFVLDLREGKALLAALRLAAVAVLGYGVACYFNGAGAGIGFGLALLAAIAVQAQRARADARSKRYAEMTTAAYVGVALGNVMLLLAGVLGTLAFWTQRGY